MHEPFYRRTYEKPFSQINMPPHYYGFTNRILSQQKSKKNVCLFIPTYVILKIKSLQSVDIKSLTGSINAVLIVNVLIEGLPAPLVHLLKEGVQIQINRSEPLLLRDNNHEESKEGCISLKQSKKMLTFTVRKTLTATIYEDTLWSPFEIIRLVISITFNSIKKDGEQILAAYNKYQDEQSKKKKTYDQTSQLMDFSVVHDKVIDQSHRNHFLDSKNKFDKLSKTNYAISFNCMRNGLKIPISYALGITYSLYDLAENLLQTYYTKDDSYTGVIQQYKKVKDEKNKSKQQNKNKNKNKNRKSGKDKQFYRYIDKYDLKNVKSHQQKRQCLQEIFESSLNGSEQNDNKKQKKKQPNPHYYQYVHFVIPLYKYPGNSLATIFTPVFLLSLLSLSIFFQDNELSGRIGSIATMVLGYIALIPSVKEQLPPSSRLAYIELVIYISTLCCMLSLAQSFLIDDNQSYVFNWRRNYLFLTCLFVHCSTFLLVVFVMIIHKYIWQPSYNRQTELRPTFPQKNPEEWINFFCDQDFYCTNTKIHDWNRSEEKNKLSMVKKYSSEMDDEQGQVKEEWSKRQKSMMVSNETSAVTTNFKPTQSRVIQKGQKSVQFEAGSKELKEGEGVRERVSKFQKQKEKASESAYYLRLLGYLDDQIHEGKHITFRVESRERVKRRNELTKDILQKFIK